MDSQTFNLPPHSPKMCVCPNQILHFWTKCLQREKKLFSGIPKFRELGREAIAVTLLVIKMYLIKYSDMHL